MDLILVAIFLIIAVTIWWYATIPSNLPPGPRGWPVLGSALDTWRSSTLYVKLCKWTELYGPLYKVYVGNKLVLILGDWNMIQEALVKQGDTYAGRPTFHTLFPEEIAGKGLVDTEGELWKTQRRFALSTLRDFGIGRPIIEPRIKDEADYLLEKIANENNLPFDPAPVLSNAVSNVICALVFGKRFDYDDEQFHRLLRALRTRFTETDISILTPFVLSETISKMMANLPQLQSLKATNMELLSFIKDQTNEVMKNGPLNKGEEPTNYIQAFCKAQQEQDDNWTFTNPQLIGSVANLFVAGTDTTATTLRWALFFLAHHPEIQDEVYEEIQKETGGGQSLLDYADRTKLPYTEATIMETQRMADLVPLGVMRRTIAPSKLCGYDIPVGTIVVPLLAAVLTDPKTYPNPDKFDPTRFLSGSKSGGKEETHTHLIPFLAGKRVCLGESLAKMELFIFFTALISKYKFYFSPDEPKPPMEALVSIIRAPIPYKVCAKRRMD
jgi:cytochrome P450 family 2 subfamily J